MYKLIVITLLLLIIFNLILGFYYIIKDKKQSNRGFQSLRTRIVLSVLLFIVLIAGYYLGLITPHGV